MTSHRVRRLSYCFICRGMEFKENMMPLPLCYGPKPLERTSYEHVECYLARGGDPDTIPVSVLLRTPYKILNDRGYGATALRRADEEGEAG